MLTETDSTRTLEWTGDELQKQKWRNIDPQTPYDLREDVGCPYQHHVRELCNPEDSPKVVGIDHILKGVDTNMRMVLICMGPVSATILYLVCFNLELHDFVSLTDTVSQASPGRECGADLFGHAYAK